MPYYGIQYVQKYKPVLWLFIDVLQITSAIIIGFSGQGIK